MLWFGISFGVVVRSHGRQRHDNDHDNHDNDDKPPVSSHHRPPTTGSAVRK